MAAGDIVLGQGGGAPLGYAQGISRAVPANGTSTFTSVGDQASVKSALSDGSTRVICAAGITFDSESEFTVAAGTQWYCPNGALTIDGRSYTGAVDLVKIAGDDVFIGNIILQPSIGQSGQSNNASAALETISVAHPVGFYAFYVGIEPDTAVGTMSGDSPESISIWNNSGAGDLTKLITMHGVYIPTPRIFDTKHCTGGGAASAQASNTYVTWYRGYSHAYKRAPRGSDSINYDIVNFVQPDIDGSVLVGIDISSDTNTADIRGCSIYGNGGSFGDVNVGSASASVYYVTSGAGVDNNVELNSPTVSANVQGTTALGAYTGKPTATAMDGTLRSTILAEVAGTYSITQEAPPTSIDPISAGHSSWLSFHKAVPGIFYWEPTEQRVKDYIFGALTFRRRIGRGLFSFERSYHYRGLEPQIERPQSFCVPPRKSFALSGV